MKSLSFASVVPTAPLRLVTACLVTLAVAACGGPTEKAPPQEPTCGNGRLDSGEVCDPFIISGEGACPESCAAGATACGGFELVGDEDACTARCEWREVTECVDGDGCCAEGCDAQSDGDCSATCGDGVVDPGETCDGNCPTCDASACNAGGSTGSAATCSLECLSAPVSECIDGDGCCPDGCSESNDDDCRDSCGDGVLVAGETCDGDCPESCDDGDACTVDRLSGEKNLCNVVCVFDPVSQCVDGDGCCPSGCDHDSDDDCACVPRTCSQAGAACGQIADGCGGTLDCGGCQGGDTCVDNQCSSGRPVGSACTNSDQCESGECLESADYEGGYCTNTCERDTECAIGSNCVYVDAAQSGICAKNCQASNECRGGIYECWNYDGHGPSECLPYPGGDGVNGDACQNVGDCDILNTICIRTGGFDGGYCSAVCEFNFECDLDAVCLESSGTGLCVATCVDQSDCRSGYQCMEVTNGATGESVGTCVPD